MDNKKIAINLEVPDLGYVMGMSVPEEVAFDIINRVSLAISDYITGGMAKTMPTQVTVPSPVNEVCPTQSPQVADVLPVGKRGYPFTHDMFKYSKVITYTCPHCGKVTFRRMTLADSNITHCHFCREEVEIRTVAKTIVKCPHCNSEEYTGWVANGTEVIGCKDCNAEVDIVYSTDNLTARTWNLEI